ncbi:class I adenylate-forming enzyme family protein [Streptomyces griseoviridis]|uniref:Acyl-coenzyme A synthetase/AMP-(Fatty) acid ligase n=1 Tax=Streptomyces griseoviridis TaxID=45398 RepID=A0ABT9L8F8_STRGD|nr:class I adenylate-forming enzyme family protein [Streptomyces griseoviridis]MDP9679580.1 acyl-coenzyme A synthetase/AMP-(fatty) acid ligase [Streptomyces griseoviridis]GGT00104.1 AMP-dependent synthetase [Streptomyces griseoviridis]
MTEPFPGAVLDLLGAAGDRVVFEHLGREVTGAALLADVRRVTHGLRRRGVRPGDGVALLLGVSPEAFAAVVAAHTVGARVVGVRPGLTGPQRAHLLADVPHRITDRPDDTPDTSPSATVLPLAELLAAPDDGVRPRVTARPDDIARLIHTSGSTGLPKACAQTYAAMTAAWALRPDAWPPAVRELAARLDRFLVFGTLASQVMMEYGLLTLAAGGTLVTADPPVFPDALVRHRATAGVITVARLTRLVAAQRESPVDLGSLRALMVSGSPPGPARLREAAEVLGPVVFHGYGQTETGMISMATPADEPGSLGVPPVELEVRGPGGRPVPPGTDGELYVRTPSQSCGYWREPGLTAEVFTPDGWVRTRDLGHLDGAGRLWLTGRARDVVIVNANVYYTGPVERLLGTHPAVAEAYVTAVPDDSTGEAVHAFVVPAAGRVPVLAELRALVTDRLGEACAPARLTLIDEVPLTPAGKPDKRRLAVGN